ncbi:MAG: PAS domain S-box protein, partial [Steroidobacter sp.]
MIKVAARIVLPYVIFTILWLLVFSWSSRSNELRSLHESVYQYLAFVLASALWLAYLVNKAWRTFAEDQRELYESEARLRLLDNLPDSYVYQYTQLEDGAPKFLYISAGVERLQAVTVQEVLNDANALLSQINPAMIDDLRAAEIASRQSFTDFSMEVQVRSNDGRERWMMLCSRPQRSADGRVLWNGVATDVTERKLVEIKHQIVEQRLADIIEFLPDATFVIDDNKCVVAWNRACEILTGVKKEIMIGRGNHAYAEPFFGATRPILIDLVNEPSAQLEAGYKYIQRKSGVIVGESIAPHLNNGRGAHLLGIAASLFDPAGHCYGAIEVVRDVTEQRRIEQALRDSEQKYRELVELANSIILRWNAEGIITFVNEFGLKFFGYAANEL